MNYLDDCDGLTEIDTLSLNNSLASLNTVISASASKTWFVFLSRLISEMKSAQFIDKQHKVFSFSHHCCQLLLPRPFLHLHYLLLVRGRVEEATGQGEKPKPLVSNPDTPYPQSTPHRMPRGARS